MATIKGFIDASILTREIDEGIEFLIVTNWSSIDAIKEFADVAVVPALVQDI